jgi:phytoene/squalene synthetase
MRKKMNRKTNSSRSLAADITRTASAQTYYTIRFLVDRELVPDAYRAYAYFRWVDDILDAGTGSQADKFAFLERQQSLLEACYRMQAPVDLDEHEQLLADLIANDGENNSGLQSYLRNMMAVMAFDVKRRGRLITQAELAEYSRLLATAVTEALHYFIGHDCPPPCSEKRYRAVQGAHVVHMLRDALGDTSFGYINIPAEYLQAQDLSVQDTDQRAYREWVRARVKLARAYFNAGRDYLTQVKNLRCRLAGFAYMARFEWMLRTIERDGYRLRSAYPERKSLPAGLWMAWRTLTSIFGFHRLTLQPSALAVQAAHYEER